MNEHFAYLLEEQRDLELTMVDQGIARYRKMREDSPNAQMSPEQCLIVEALDEVIPAIEEVQQSVAQGNMMMGVRKWGMPFLCLPAEKIALIGFVTMFNMADKKGETFLKICLAIADSIKQERMFSLLKEDAPDIYKRLSLYVKSWDRRSLAKARKEANLDGLRWSTELKTWLGVKVIELIMLNCNYFEIVKVLRQGKVQSTIKLRREVWEEIEKQHSNIEMCYPVYLPMVVPPVEWQGLKDGGYVYRDTTLIKAPRSATTADLEERMKFYERTDISRVKQAVNLIQNTAFRINKENLAVLKQIWKANGNYAGVPPRNRLDLPPKPDDIGTNKEAREKWKRAAAKVYDEDARIMGQRKVVMSQMWIADRFSKYERIYFPWQLDWRGRAYPLPVGLQPQGDDVARGLLEFANGKKLGKRGGYWLMVHAANCYGYDKHSYDDRVAWVHDNWQMIKDSATNPFRNKGWASADKPFQFLAVCRELSEAVINGACDPNFVSHIPVAMDGTCNGLQHYAALGRDPIGAASTNLEPSPSPSDIYTSIAGVVEQAVIADALEENPYAIEWAGKIERKLVKRAAMTTPYGLTHEGMKRQFITDGWCADFPQPYKSAAYIRDKTEDALKVVCASAKEIMAWLQEVAGIASDEDIPLYWITPIGFPVYQEYLRLKMKRIATTIGKLNLRLSGGTKGVSKHKQIRGIAPNYVHSLDAAHMMLAVIEMGNHGITDFLMVHDSYAVHATDVDTLHRVVRESFVSMHSRPLVRELREQLQEQVNESLPEPPATRGFDLNKVLDSLYFFS